MMIRTVSAASGCGSPIPVRRAFPTMMIMMLLPVVMSALLGMINSWGGFIEAAFMDMTLTLEGFDYGFGPAECGGWHECGNATFESYQHARLLSFALFVMALVAVALKDMMKGAFGAEMSLGEVDRKSFPEMLKYSVLVFVLLLIFPPVWDAASGLMHNIGVWILNPHYDLAGKGAYEHGSGGRGNMCVGDITHDDMVTLAPFARHFDKWAVYRNGDTDPMRNGQPAGYGNADNYLVRDGEVLRRACLHDANSDTCPWNGASGYSSPAGRPGMPAGYNIGDILCSPDYRVKYVFRQAIGTTEMSTASPEQILGAVSGVGGDDIMVAILTQFIKSSVTIQIIMVVFMTGVMVDVVTAFALAIIPVVAFYRFLPMSDKVRLGDYSGAAFALLAMPMVASLVLVAGSGAVANMAVDEGDAFDSFFTWLTALSVVLLVIGIPATMVPLIGAGVQQATAAVQTGVQTAQFAGTAIAASAGGAIRGARAQAEYGRLSRMNAGSMTPAQRTRLTQLSEQGYGNMSRARAALSGGMGGMRGQLYDAQGQPTNQFRQAVMPETGRLTAASVQGLMGSGVGDQSTRMSGLAGSLAGAATSMAGSTIQEVRAGSKPTNREMLAEAGRQKAEADKNMKAAQKETAVTGKAMNDTLRGYDGAAEKRKYDRLAAGEGINLDTANERLQEIWNKQSGLAAKIRRAEGDLTILEGMKSTAPLTPSDRAELKSLEKGLRQDRRSLDRLTAEAENLNMEAEHANAAMQEHKKRSAGELARMETSPDTPQDIRDAITANREADEAQVEAKKQLDAANHNQAHMKEVVDKEEAELRNNQSKDKIGGKDSAR